MTPVSSQNQTQPLRKVLLIEDDRGQARVVEASFAKFAKEKFELFWASSYEEGLAALRQNQFDACLLDYQLGPRSGLDLLREIGELGIDTPVIFVTSESSPEIDDQAMQLGALDYLVKFELSPRSLERSLRYTMKQHATLRELRRLVARDPLTGLYSRREGLELLEHEVERARKYSRALTILLIEIDRLDEIAQAHGNEIGDQTIAATARILRETKGDASGVIRWSPARFGMWLPHTDAVTGSRMAEALVAATRPLNFTLSVGVAEWNSGRADAADLIAAAERAVGEARARGGDRVA
ncbi:MAG TPA: diguanylate cyclase [Luteolibacter sp.]